MILSWLIALSATKYDLSKIDDTYSDGFNVLAFCYWWLTGEKKTGFTILDIVIKVDTLFDALATLVLFRGKLSDSALAGKGTHSVVKWQTHLP